MKRDFTLSAYKSLCNSLISNNFNFKTIEAYVSSDTDTSKLALIRHDVDKNPLNALKIAKIENSLGICSTFYFRIVENVFNKNIIKEISSLGHEIGYHYEVLAKNNGDREKAIYDFEINLKKLRAVVPIKTICMHGSPLSKWKDSNLWNDYNFEDYGIKGEAFLSLNYDEILYFTDTGRRWNGSGSNVRDKVSTNLNYSRPKSTYELISQLSEINKSVSINSHPQRWHENFFYWFSEYFLQNCKNIGKKYILKK
ncbi:MAG: hypothetical protein ACJZ37_03245 [Candidatus Poseidoniales archaeon]